MCTGKKNKTNVRTNSRRRCISFKGVLLWNNVDIKELKLCRAITKFKKMFKSMVINAYKTAFR